MGTGQRKRVMHNPEYAQRLIKIIEENNLQRLIKGEKAVAEFKIKEKSETINQK